MKISSPEGIVLRALILMFREDFFAEGFSPEEILSYLRGFTGRRLRRAPNTSEEIQKYLAYLKHAGLVEERGELGWQISPEGITQAEKLRFKHETAPSTS